MPLVYASVKQVACLFGIRTGCCCLVSPARRRQQGCDLRLSDDAAKLGALAWPALARVTRDLLSGAIHTLADQTPRLEAPAGGMA
ncbi:MAG: hypothetical protein ACHQ1E_11655 [Ktedonobacterales bacterium]|jgi:hypothetical protein